MDERIEMRIKRQEFKTREQSEVEVMLKERKRTGEGGSPRRI